MLFNGTVVDIYIVNNDKNISAVCDGHGPPLLVCIAAGCSPVTKVIILYKRNLLYLHCDPVYTRYDNRSHDIPNNISN